MALERGVSQKEAGDILSAQRRTTAAEKSEKDQNLDAEFNQRDAQTYRSEGRQILGHQHLKSAQVEGRRTELEGSPAQIARKRAD